MVASWDGWTLWKTKCAYIAFTPARDRGCVTGPGLRQPQFQNSYWRRYGAAARGITLGLKAISLDARRDPNQCGLQRCCTGGAKRSLSIPLALFRKAQVDLIE
jgi:hypothetical protein